MKIEAYLCDFCGTETKSAATIQFTGESQMDPSGNGYVHETVPIDFCPACRDKALREYVVTHPEKWRKPR